MKASEILQEIFRLNGITTEHYNWLMREVKELEKECDELKGEMTDLVVENEAYASQWYHNEEYVEIGKALKWLKETDDPDVFYVLEYQKGIDGLLELYREEVDNG